MNKSIVSSTVDVEAEKGSRFLLDYLVIHDYCGEDKDDNNENKNMSSDMCHIDDSFSN